MDRNRAEEIIAQIYDGGSFREIMPTSTEALAFADFCENNADIDRQYHRAQAARAEMLAHEVVSISDTEMDAQIARNRIQSRQWYASKIMPQKYGERLELNLKGTVDISAALTEARNRARLPCDSTDVIELQATDIKQVSDSSATDQTSVALPDPFDETPKDGGIDPFS